MSRDSFTNFISGIDKPTVANLKKTHRLLGKIKETKKGKIFGDLQGEFWSPMGEANALIISKGLGHTSMSVGDVIKTGGKYFVVAGIGFEEIT